jgi:hypothetical protein
VNAFTIRIYNLGKKNIIALTTKAFVMETNSVTTKAFEMETNSLNKGASLLIKTVIFYKSSKEFLSQ